MTRPRIGAVTIGQTPRPDLLEPLLERVGGEAEIIETGALDGLDAEVLAARQSGGAPNGATTYPLTTRLRDGTRVTFDESELAPLVQRAIDRAEDAGADVTLLLCAGGFLGATSRGHLVRPFDAAAERLREIGAHRIALLVPFAGQAVAAQAKWNAAGFETMVEVGDPASYQPGQDADSMDALVLDYVGHPSAAVRALRGRIGVPVVDLGEAALDRSVAALDERLTARSATGR